MIVLNGLSILKYRSYANGEVFTKSTRPILELEKKELLKKEINQLSFPISYDFCLQNYRGEEINGTEFEFTIAIETSEAYFPVSYRLIEAEQGKEISLIGGKSKPLTIQQGTRQNRKFQLILDWQEWDKKLAENFEMVLKIETEPQIGIQIEKTILKLTRDDSLPSVNVSYSTQEITNQNVMVTIKCEKEIQPVSGFKLEEDGKTLTKEITENHTETVSIRDFSGNVAETEYSVNNIDKIPPQIIGCENGGIYESPLPLSYYDNDVIKEIKIEKYAEKLSISACQIDKNTSDLTVHMDASPLGTRKYRYYRNNKLYTTVTEKNYVFPEFQKEKDEIKIEALDEFGQVLDTAMVEEISQEEAKENLLLDENELTQKRELSNQSNGFCRK